MPDAPAKDTNTDPLASSQSLKDFRKLYAASKGIFNPPDHEDPEYDRRLIAANLLAVDPEAKISEISASSTKAARPAALANLYTSLAESGVNTLSPKERAAYISQLKPRYISSFGLASKELSDQFSKGGSESFRKHLLPHEQTFLSNWQRSYLASTGQEGRYPFPPHALNDARAAFLRAEGVN